MAENEKPPGPRQAVVLIHGIGEQRPMETLRGFVDAFLDGEGYHSKPDMLSDTYEMRRLKLRRYVPEGTEPRPSVNRDWPETDFYEYYWAHQMYGTTIAHIMSWLCRILSQGVRVLFQKDEKKRVHRRLRWLVPVVWLVVLVVAAATAVFAVKEFIEPSKLTVGVGLAALTFIWGLARPSLLGKLTDVAGDAARYFDIRPKNISRRYDIIRGGIDILRKLHTDHDEHANLVNYRYGRIVLVGHSLGSVIAYDILKHYWQEVNGKMEVDPGEFAAVENYEGGNGKAPTRSTAHSDEEQFRCDQYKAWQYLNRHKIAGETRLFDKDHDPPHDARWLISDFVTLGCPMTYAPLLMAKSVEDVTTKIALRELPTCPPDRSKNLNPGRFTVQLSAELQRIRGDFYILPHSAQFATTRWTNFYFDNDLIGGPLGAIFGDGIDDRPLQGPTLRPIAAHVGYWNKHKLKDAPRCVAHLEKILKNLS